MPIALVSVKTRNLVLLFYGGACVKINAACVLDTLCDFVSE